MKNTATKKSILFIISSTPESQVVESSFMNVAHDKNGIALRENLEFAESEATPALGVVASRNHEAKT